MLETIIATTTGESFTFVNALIVIFASIFLGIITSCVYMYTNAKRGYNQGFLTTLIMLPVIIAIIIPLIFLPWDILIKIATTGIPRRKMCI